MFQTRWTPHHHHLKLNLWHYNIHQTWHASDPKNSAHPHNSASTRKFSQTYYDHDFSADEKLDWFFASKLLTGLVLSNLLWSWFFSWWKTWLIFVSKLLTGLTYIDLLLLGYGADSRSICNITTTTTTIMKEKTCDIFLYVNFQAVWLHRTRRPK